MSSSSERSGPMLATSARAIPTSADFALEVKYDGFRSFVRIDCGALVLRSRNGTDITTWFPELAEIATSLRCERATIDGEVILGDGSVDSFNALLKRVRSRRRPANAPPVTFVAFDVLEIDGEDVRGLALEARRARLEALVVESERIVLSGTRHDLHQGTAVMQDVVMTRQSRSAPCVFSQRVPDAAMGLAPWGSE